MGPTAPMTAPLTYMQPTVGTPLPDPTTGVSVGYGMAPQQTTTTIGGFNTGPAPVQNQNYSYAAPPTSQPSTFAAVPAAQPQYVGNIPMGGPAGMGAPGVQGQFQAGVPQFAMFQQPIVQDMAMQYGQHLADQGKQLVENQFEKWVPVAKLKYYFAVDNKYVINKLRLLLFPFTHKVWNKSLEFTLYNKFKHLT